MKIEIISKVVNGRLERNRSLIEKAIASFEGKDIVLTIQRKRKKRSNLQNNFYWGCIIPIVQLAIREHWGEHQSINDVHFFLKQKFNYVEKVNEQSGEVVNLPKSTTLNTTVEQEEYYDKIRAFAKEWFNTDIPYPNEQIQIEL
jgi:hypothetical protein